MTSERQQYFQIHHGQKSWLLDMEPEHIYLVNQLLRSGSAEGQLPLPGFRKEGDMHIGMPLEIGKLEHFKQEQRDVLEEKLQGSAPRYALWKKDNAIAVIG